MSLGVRHENKNRYPNSKNFRKPNTDGRGWHFWCYVGGQLLLYNRDCGTCLQLLQSDDSSQVGIPNQCAFHVENWSLVKSLLQLIWFVVHYCTDGSVQFRWPQEACSSLEERVTQDTWIMWENTRRPDSCRTGPISESLAAVMVVGL